MIRVNKKEERVMDLEERISELYEIPVERLIILLRHESLYNNTVRSELYNIDWRREKKIEDASRLDHGQILYIEEGDPKGKLEQHMWP